MIYQVEVLADTPNADDFTLDDDVFGLLDGDALLAGEYWRDISPYVRSFSLRRGRDNIFGYNSAGQLTVELNNFQREFDPTLTTALYYGMVFPKKPVRFSINGLRQFTGVIQDWDLVFQPGGVSVASFDAADAFAEWAVQTLPSYTPASLKKTSEAIAEALTKIGVTDPAPSPAEGTIMTTDSVAEGTNALQYVQKLATSDFGSLYIKKDGTWDYAAFARRITGVIVGRVGQATNKAIAQAEVQYGIEDLYNKVELTFQETNLTISAEDSGSIALYGELVLQDPSSLISAGLFGSYGLVKADELLALYSTPELRIASIDFELTSLEASAQADILGYELGDRLIVAYDPDNSGRLIIRISRIIGITHSITPDAHFIQLSFESSSSTPLTLNDPDLGRLDAGNFLERTWDFSI